MKFDPFGEDNFYTLSPEEAELSEDRVTAVREAVAAAHPSQCIMENEASRLVPCILF